MLRSDIEINKSKDESMQSQICGLWRKDAEADKDQAVSNAGYVEINHLDRQ